MIDEHLVTMIKEYRNQKNKFSLAVEESDGYTVVDNKRHNKKGKGNDKGKGPAGASSSNDNAQTGKGSNKGGGKGSPAHYPGTKGKSKGKGKGASFPDMPWTDTFTPIKEGFVHGIDSTPADWIKLMRRTAVSSSPTHRAYRIGSALASTPRVLAPRCSRTLKSSSCASTRMGYVAAGSAQLPWKCHWPRTRRPHQYNVEYSWSSWARRTSPTSPTMHESRVLFKPSRQRPSVFTRT